ncbi:MAG TPA: T9SS type A sorting domain-containing protein [Bacteroidia bacterium]|jgi:hypothetical protein|nr:T9SS type A sorting domain-containing protein [Bacteroidia bacterium]
MKKRYYLSIFITMLWLGSMAQTPTVYKDVAPIFYNTCTTCHHNGGIGPMPLMNYSETFAYTHFIKTYLQGDLMPPWMPDTNYCRFINERTISATEKNKIINWIDSGATAGDTTLAPAAPVYVSNYQLKGTPDLVLRMPTYTSAAVSQDDYICVALPTGLAVDRIIRAFEIVPGNAAIVHHCIVSIDTTASAVSDYSGTCYSMPGSNVGVGGYAPGGGATIFPSKAPLVCGMKIKAGSYIVLQVHYPTGTAGKKDSTQVRFFFYPLSYNPASVRQVYSITPLQNWSMNIPPYAIKTYNANYPVGLNISLFSTFPHQHQVGTYIKEFAYSGIDTIPLMRINSWNFHWQGYYFYPKLVKIPSGYKLYSTHTYTNNDSNLSNPFNPPHTIVAGFNTSNEMLFDSFQFLVYQPGDDTINIQRIIDSDSLLSVPDETIPQKMTANTYPNPFNQQIHITFQMPEPAQATITIYSIDGTAVRTLARRKLMSNFNDVVWDGKNNQGAQLSPGIYIYTITTGKMSYNGKIVMVGK